MTSARPLLLCLLAACASSPAEPRREPAPGEEQRELDLRAAEQRRHDFQLVLLRLDQALDSYVQALANHGEIRADQQRERLEKTIRDMVLDRGPMVIKRGEQGVEPGANYRRLVAAAGDGSQRDAQAIALAALGFAGTSDVMPTILQGAQLQDPFLVDRAVLGLAVLRAPQTPPGVLAAIVENERHPEDGRVQAAWALYRLQEVSTRPAEILAVWRRYAGELRDRLPAGVLVSTVRGLGLGREAADADLVAGYLRHPVARLRMAAAVALARLNAQQHAGGLVDLLGPQETVQNVRLHARKALSDLAGGKDYGYDQQAWRKAFDRGQ